MGFKVKIIEGLLCAVSIASAQTSVTLGAFGYTHVEKPANDLTILANNFGDNATTLNDLISIDQFNGGTSFFSADQLYLWNSGSYTIYYLYDNGATVEWRDLGGNAVDPVVPTGSALWLKSAGSVVDTNLVISGNVVTDKSVTNQIITGLQMVSYPFSMNLDLNETMLGDAATSGSSFFSADQVYAWDVDNQTYMIYYLYDDGSPQGEWRHLDGTTATGTTVLGQGFWYKAMNDFVWVETNRYYNSL